MRFLLSADWHVGKTIRGRPRFDEHSQALDSLVQIAIEGKVDAVLLAGDLFEHQAPSAESEGLVHQALARLHGAKIPTVIIAGNHDNPRRLAALAHLLDPLEIRVVAEPRARESGGVIEIASRSGEESAVIACLPFVYERHLTSAHDLFFQEESTIESYAEGIGKMIESLASAFHPDAVNVFLGHMHVEGARLGGGERELTVTQAYGVNPQTLPSHANVIGLGHIHRAQRLPCAAPAIYAGSLLQMDFGEVGQEKSFSLIEARGGKPVRIENIPVDAGRLLVDLKGSFDEVITQSAQFPGAYFRVFLHGESSNAQHAQRLREALPDALDIRLPAVSSDDENMPTIKHLKPADQFAHYFRHVHSREPDPAVAEAFRRILEDTVEISIEPS